MSQELSNQTPSCLEGWILAHPTHRSLWLFFSLSRKCLPFLQVNTHFFQCHSPTLCPCRFALRPWGDPASTLPRQITKWLHTSSCTCPAYLHTLFKCSGPGHFVSSPQTSRPHDWLPTLRRPEHRHVHKKPSPSHNDCHVLNTAFRKLTASPWTVFPWNPDLICRTSLLLLPCYYVSSLVDYFFKYVKYVITGETYSFSSSFHITLGTGRPLGPSPHVSICEKVDFWRSHR